VNINPDRAVLGLATLFGVRSPHRGLIWYRHNFQRFLDLGFAVPLRLEHGSLINSRGVLKYVGCARYFQAVTQPADGLLTLVELDDDAAGFGTELLSDLERMISTSYLPPGWGFSIGARMIDDLVVPYEISLTQRPAFPDAAVLEVGPRAVEGWLRLTESRDERPLLPGPEAARRTGVER
jgi:hypothetical protein